MKQLTKTAFVFAILAAFIFSLTSFATDSLPKTFTDLLSRADMLFERPDSLVSSPIIYSHAMSYEYAIKYPGKNFEVRYAIRPSDNLWSEYDEHRKNLKKGDVITNPDSTYMAAFQTIILNVSGGLPNITEFDKASVKTEFNADWGGTVAVQPRKEFGQNYKYCMVIALHKNKKGDAYVFFLADSTEGFNQLVAPVLHSLMFNNF